ncbi:hypothetical protein DFH07DRAFT_777222 [Mycena maculata]|uniref:MYND-type domain-containing protein n=1 Tax=Mycena maculata TaxID=230809 RepID=A0AAD7N3G4_9AGAR|nr:hypothetical protein DFH07DRAFT_777222 [Mycena maculata]
MEWTWNTQNIADLNLSIAQRTKELMWCEGVLIAIALENLVYGDFEEKWKEVGLERKRELALEGLYRGACSVPRDNSRIICPELTIDGLVGDGEYNLINLLRCIMDHDPTGNRRVKEVFLLVHPYVQHEYRHSDEASDLLKAFFYQVHLLRNFCIVETLRGIVEAYHGYPFAPFMPMKFSTEARDEDRKARKRQARVESKKANLDKIVDSSQCKEEAAIVVPACSSCLKKTDRKDDLKKCGRCQMVWYCGSACQKKDWPDHKKFCGKQHFDPKILAPTPQGPAEFIGCPAVVDGFIRTPALWRQIFYLSKPDSQISDYHFDTTPGHTTSIFSRYPCNESFRAVFLVARRRAMASGSVPAIHTMFGIATYGAEDGVTIHDVTIEQVRRQFEGDYRIEITPASIQSAEPFSQPTPQELEEERSYLS